MRAYLGGMTSSAVGGAAGAIAAPGVALGSEFARVLPELGAPWDAFRPEHPSALVVNDDLASELGLDPEWLRSERGLRFLLGNELPVEASPVSQIYAGHQFGAYNPRLGDGRALLLGEIRRSDGALRDLHLKGSGPTPFARADGYAAVGPMLREYLMGEAMHALGIPTTRALAVISTGRHLLRPESLDPVPGAVLVRTASSHLRVGTFQFVRSTGDVELLRRLVDYAIERHSPAVSGSETPALGLLQSVIDAQARLVASWMLVGFVHGVMNTDNMTVSGETIDYGPCAFLDAYDPAAAFSSIDHGGRYAYGNQPGIAQWNLTRFAEALLPALGNGDDGGSADRTAKDRALEALAGFTPAYERTWLTGFRSKLGLGPELSDRPADAATDLAAAMLDELRTHRIDYTAFFRALADSARGDDVELRRLYGPGAPGAWHAEWLALSPDADAMDAVNPVYIPRNELVDEALETAAEGDLAPFSTLLDAVTRPFEPRPGLERFGAPPATSTRRHVTYCGT